MLSIGIELYRAEEISLILGTRRPAVGIEPGSPQGTKCRAPRAAEATLGATAKPLEPPLSTADYR